MPNTVDNQLLVSKPMDFMKKFAVSPPDDAGWSAVPKPGSKLKTLAPNQTLGASREIWKDPTHTVLPADLEKIDHQQIIKGKTVWADVTNVERDKPGAKSFKLSMLEEPDLVPMFYLPWSSGKLMELRIPKLPTGMDSDDYPKLFFTAALSGCSVFVDGASDHPRVVHAGLSGASLKKDASDFWRDMLGLVVDKTGVAIDDHLREINKHDYMKTDEAKAFKAFLTNEHRNQLEIKEVDEWASVFGIRFGRIWSFYMQHNATVTTVRVVKKEDTTKVKRADKSSSRVLRGKGVEVQEKVIPGSGLFSFSKTLYLVKEQVTLPMRICEFYPSGTARITPQRRVIAF